MMLDLFAHHVTAREPEHAEVRPRSPIDVAREAMARLRLEVGRTLDELREEGADNEHFEGELADQDDDEQDTVVELRPRGGDAA